VDEDGAAVGVGVGVGMVIVLVMAFPVLRARLLLGHQRHVQGRDPQRLVQGLDLRENRRTGLVWFLIFWENRRVIFVECLDLREFGRAGLGRRGHVVATERPGTILTSSGAWDFLTF
jgi:hypothetical protein